MSNCNADFVQYPFTVVIRGVDSYDGAKYHGRQRFHLVVPQTVVLHIIIVMMLCIHS